MGKENPEGWRDGEREAKPLQTQWVPLQRQERAGSRWQQHF